jgi:hypothetical protein
MCWEIDYPYYAEQQKKMEEARIKQEQRAGVIKDLLNDANKPGETTGVAGTPADEVAPAK